VLSLKETKSKSFIEGTLVLMISGIIVKVIGMLFSVPLTNMYGAEGNGIFTQAYYIYTAAFIISTAGLPVAVSKMVSEANALGRVREVRKIAKVALISFVFIGVFFTAAIMIGADWLTSTVLQSSLSYYAVLAIAPSIFFVSVVSAIRGYYQGLSNMVPTAISQVIEAVGKLVVGFLLAKYLLDRGYALEIVVAGAIMGVTVGTVLSAVYIVIVRATDKSARLSTEGTDLTCDSGKNILKRLIKIAVPITIGASVLSITNLVDMFVVMRRLQFGGMIYEEANYLYGAYGMSVKFFNVPQTIIAGIGISVIPAISAALAKNEQEKSGRLVESSLRLTGLLAFPCAAGLFALAKPILDLFYYKQPQDVEVAYPLLQLLTPSVIFVGLVSVTNSILQANGKERIPVITMISGGLIKLVVNYILVGMPGVNIHGAPIGTLCCYGAIAVLNLFFIAKLKLRFSFVKAFAKPFLCALVMGVFAWYLFDPLKGFLGNGLGVLVTVGASVVIYGLLLIVTRAMPKEDILMIPGGSKIVKILRIK